MTSTDFDVVIVGYGPVGQALAAMLGQAGHRVGVFERWPGLYPLPRACVVDHEAMRILQSVGVAEAFSRLAVPTNGEYVWLNAQGQTLYHFQYERQGISGWPARHLMYQPDLEGLLDRRVREIPAVAVHQGWEAVACELHGTHARLEVAHCVAGEGGGLRRSGVTRQVTARYVVGADGANSFVRQAAGLPWTNLGFRADWLVVDYRPHRPEQVLDMPEAGQICDPRRPMTLMRHMGHRHVRWEMMLLPGETAQDVTPPDKVWPMIARWVAPKDGVIERAAVYTFRSGVAQRWAGGRAVLAGDAAHLMPPFLGQGLCSGLRDALALAWRLDLILRDAAPEALLCSYEDERKRHVCAVIDRAVALGKVVCITDPEAAARRDEAILSGTAPPVPRFPTLETGLLHRGTGGALEPPVGELALQARVSSGTAAGRLDDVAGHGWHVLSLDGDPRPLLTEGQRAFSQALGLRWTAFRREGGGIVDADGAYRHWMQGLGVAAVVVRPDFYVFGAARSLHDLPGLLDDLQRQLACRADAAG